MLLGVLVAFFIPDFCIVIEIMITQLLPDHVQSLPLANFAVEAWPTVHTRRRDRDLITYIPFYPVPTALSYSPPSFSFHQRALPFWATHRLVQICVRPVRHEYGLLM